MPEPRRDNGGYDDLRQDGLDKKADPQPMTDPANLLPPGAVARFGNLKYLVPDFIRSAAQSADGKLIAIANMGSAVYVYDTATRRLVHRFTITPRSWYPTYSALSFSPDGR